jgi:hypothetical protein
MNDTFQVVLMVLVGILIGNVMADQATLKYCATTGQARMMGGGTVLCQVKREELK